jgi:hypothetical protein
VVVGLLALAACSSAEPAAQVPSATVPTAPATTTTTDPYAVPAVIDAAYVNRVLAGLDAVVGDVVRLVVRTKTIPPEGVERLRAIYGTDAMLDLILDSLSRDLAQGLSAYRQDPGDRRSSVSELISGDKSCIFARVARDYSAVSLNPLPQLTTQWVGLVPLDQTRDPRRHNAVGWMLVYDGAERNFGAPPTNPCRAL